jgi:hypothetical protein
VCGNRCAITLKPTEGRYAKTNFKLFLNKFGLAHVKFNEKMKVNGQDKVRTQKLCLCDVRAHKESSYFDNFL